MQIKSSKDHFLLKMTHFAKGKTLTFFAKIKQFLKLFETCKWNDAKIIFVHNETFWTYKVRVNGYFFQFPKDMWDHLLRHPENLYNRVDNSWSLLFWQFIEQDSNFGVIILIVLERECIYWHEWPCEYVQMMEIKFWRNPLHQNCC